MMHALLLLAQVTVYTNVDPGTGHRLTEPVAVTRPILPAKKPVERELTWLRANQRIFVPEVPLDGPSILVADPGPNWPIPRPTWPSLAYRIQNGLFLPPVGVNRGRAGSVAYPPPRRRR